jgi:hypothetical protein
VWVCVWVCVCVRVSQDAIRRRISQLLNLSVRRDSMFTLQHTHDDGQITCYYLRAANSDCLLIGFITLLRCLIRPSYSASQSQKTDLAKGLSEFLY